MSFDYFDPSFDPELILFTGIPENDAEGIANRYGLNPERVLKILQNLLEIDMYKWGDPYVTVLEEALKCMHGNQAVELFENCDLVKFKNRYTTNSNMYFRQYNIYPFEKFTTRLENFIKYQITIKERLIETGFVDYKDATNTGLNRCLATLYYVKPYYKYMIFASEKDFEMFIEYYKLQNISKEKYVAYHKLIRKYTYIKDIDDLKRSEYCHIDEDILYIGYSYGIFAYLKSYEEVEYFEFLPDGMGEKLDELRPKVFEMRLEVLKILLKAVEKEDVTTLREDCTNKILSMNFTHNEAKILLSADRILSNLEGVPSDHYYNVMVRSVGLTDLFYLIGFLENEIVNRTEQKITQIWQENPIKDSFTSYLEILNHPEEVRISTLLDKITELENARREYIDSFNEKLKTFVEESLKVERHVFIPKKHEQFWDVHHAKFEEMVRYYEGKDTKLVVEKSHSPKQEKDRVEHGYKCRDEIYIPGTHPKKRQNTIYVNGREAKISDRAFILLIRLVQELKSDPEGWILTNTLDEEGIIPNTSDYQPYLDLKKPITALLLKENPDEFLENDGSKHYRISTHPDFITYDKEKLLKHILPKVREIAAKLPD